MPNKSRPPPIRNQPLAALPGEEDGRLLPHLESVPLPFMEVLYEGGEPIRHVYFPDDDPEQKPADWEEKKERVLSEAKGAKE